jgi:hypothetical protein
MQTLHSLRSFRALRAVSSGQSPRPTAFPSDARCTGDGETPNPRGSRLAARAILMRKAFPQAPRQQPGAGAGGRCHRRRWYRRCCSQARVARLALAPFARDAALQRGRGAMLGSAQSVLLFAQCVARRWEDRPGRRRCAFSGALPKRVKAV